MIHATVENRGTEVPRPHASGVTVTDPRENYDDLHEVRDETEVDRESFADRRGTEAFESGWVATAVVVDSAGRVLLVRDGDAEAWYAPGGTLQPGESLAEGVVREVREETGIEIEPKRPHGVTDAVVRCAGDSVAEELSFSVVTYAAEPVETEIPEDSELGLEDESIETAEWFDEFPDGLLWGERVEIVLERIER